jgi:hypothetical protein
MLIELVQSPLRAADIRSISGRMRSTPSGSSRPPGQDRHRSDIAATESTIPNMGTAGQRTQSASPAIAPADVWPHGGPAVVQLRKRPAQ